MSAPDGWPEAWPDSPPRETAGARDAGAPADASNGGDGGATVDASADATREQDAAGDGTTDGVDARDARSDGRADRFDGGGDGPTEAGAASSDGPLDDATDGGDEGHDEGDDGGDGGDAPPPGHPPGDGELAITEILINPAGSDTNREWFELVSLSREPLDLAGLHVADSGTEIAVAGGILAPGARLVLGQSADQARNGGAAVDAAYGGKITFNNDADRVSVCLGPCGPTTLLATFAWSALPAAYDGHAVVLGDDRLCPATEPFGTAGSYGTPGGTDPVCP